jgi:hypothetical protein
MFQVGDLHDIQVYEMRKPLLIFSDPGLEIVCLRLADREECPFHIGE